MNNFFPPISTIWDSHRYQYWRLRYRVSQMRIFPFFSICTSPSLPAPPPAAPISRPVADFTGEQGWSTRTHIRMQKRSAKKSVLGEDQEEEKTFEDIGTEYIQEEISFIERRGVFFGRGQRLNHNTYLYILNGLLAGHPATRRGRLSRSTHLFASISDRNQFTRRADTCTIPSKVRSE